MQKYSNKYVIRTSECDNNFNIRLSALWDIMQDVAVHHAGFLGFGHETMLKNGNFFALMRMNVKIKRYPKSQEKITVETYPAGIYKIFCVRKYNIFDEKGEKIAEGTSLWIIVDAGSNRPLRPNKAYPKAQFTNSNYEGETPEKIGIPESFDFLRKVTAEFCDIDANNHVNNSRYINWLENAIRPDRAPIKELNANYVLETKIGDELDILRNSDTFVLKDKEGNERFAAEVKFWS